ncbi:Nif3-like dinuclear metal center hexameric protein [Gangjinia marincola]|uniref:GTP cyclohydrolase 1 type 2 homolog n=1 Tax=Gangjinia marincola TaxID=578463 RepID=A0ABN1MJY3_9FLAO
MRINQITALFEEIAPLHYAEDFDNVGLLVGDDQQECTGVLVTHDALEEVVMEAVKNQCNLIVTFHPIVFSGLKKITPKTYIERAVIKAIKNDIAIFAIHTAYDNSKLGVNHLMCEALGLENTKTLIPQSGNIKKLTTYAPIIEADRLKKALFKAGAGDIGNYDQCSFTNEGTGSFRPNENAKPSIGKKGTIHHEPEAQINVIFAAHQEANVLNALHSTHSYEEVAFEIIRLDNIHQDVGMGMVGELNDALGVHEFLKHCKEIFGPGCIRHSHLSKNTIKRVAVLGGSGAFAIKHAIRAKADVFLTGDLKYHDFYTAENKLIIADIGHFESERHTKRGLHQFLTKKLPNFAVILSEENTNPVYYF